jgi:hypothetical protein
MVRAVTAALVSLALAVGSRANAVVTAADVAVATPAGVPTAMPASFDLT